MDRVFNLYLAKADQPESGAYAELSLPATPYQIQDAFDKLRLADCQICMGRSVQLSRVF